MLKKKLKKWLGIDEINHNVDQAYKLIGLVEDDTKLSIGIARGKAEQALREIKTKKKGAVLQQRALCPDANVVLAKRGPDERRLLAQILMGTQYCEVAV